MTQHNIALPTFVKNPLKNVVSNCTAVVGNITRVHVFLVFSLKIKTYQQHKCTLLEELQYSILERRIL